MNDSVIAEPSRTCKQNRKSQGIKGSLYKSFGITSLEAYWFHRFMVLRARALAKGASVPMNACMERVGAHTRWWTFVRHFAMARWRMRRLRGERLRAFQDAQARAIVRLAVARSAFYRRHFAGHSLADWQALPTVDKSLMMANFDAQ